MHLSLSFRKDSFNSKFQSVSMIINKVIYFKFFIVFIILNILKIKWMEHELTRNEG